MPTDITEVFLCVTLVSPKHWDLYPVSMQDIQGRGVSFGTNLCVVGS